jgi:thioesterase domain-containing protein
LIDTPTPELEIHIDAGSALNRIYLRLKIVFGLTWRDRLSWLRERAQHKMREIANPLMPTLHGFIREYVPQPYSGKLTLFSATHEFYAVSDRYLGWSQLVKNGIEVYEIPGSHRSILLERSKARILSQQLQNCLKNVN